jgi:pSer/pThr/pTyr-binding forkhead associated (FHA) protein
VNICKRCGKENQEHYKFCLGCGGELTSSAAPAGGGSAQKTMMAQVGVGPVAAPAAPAAVAPTPPGGVPALGAMPPSGTPGLGVPSGFGAVAPSGPTLQPPPPMASPASAGPPGGGAPFGGAPPFTSAPQPGRPASEARPPQPPPPPPGPPPGAIPPPPGWAGAPPPSPFGTPDLPPPRGPQPPPYGAPQPPPPPPAFGGPQPPPYGGPQPPPYGGPQPPPYGAPQPPPFGAPQPPPFGAPPAPIFGGAPAGAPGFGGPTAGFAAQAPPLAPVAPRPPSGQQPVVGAGPRACPNCGSEVPGSFQFCGNCGAHLGPPVVRPPSADMVAARPAPIVEPKPHGRLTLIRPDGSEGGTHELEEGENRIGRAHGALFENDGYLSPLHAEIVVNAAGAVIRDLGSLNGVFTKMQGEEELQSGDVFRIGQELLRFDAIAPPQPLEDGTEIMGSPNPGYWGRLSVIIGKDIDGSAYPLFGDAVTIGRERGDINFPDDGYVSGVHARITQRDGKIVIADLGSSNGTFVRLRGERSVQDGAMVLFGQQLFRMNFSVG